VRELAPLVVLGVPLFALLVAPWVWALYRAAGWPAVQECLLNNTVGRFTHNQAGGVYGHRQPVWYYLTAAPAVLLPWSLALPAMLKGGLLRRAGGNAAESRRLLFATFCLGVLLLSAAASKRELYLLPLLPAYAACVAWWLAGTPEAAEHGRWDRPTLHLLLALAAVLPLLLAAVALLTRLRPPASLAFAPLQAELSPARLALVAAAAVAASGLLLTHLVRSWRQAPGPGWVLIPFLLLFCFIQAEVKAWIDPVKSLHDLTAAIARYLPGSAPVPAYLSPRVSSESLFGIVGFDLGRRTLPLGSPTELYAYLERAPGARVVCRAEEARRLPPELLSRLRFLYDETGRKALPYAIVEKTP
jgi:4-amino-4-deoxy-L-arabinose transferase-like glycosyltransferase